ncbi:MAG: HYR domain-containing protein [Lewinellaceae bacterium]|nr:HYR domain-containing protein [Saprospiraceae bacterium]MCB9337015.1 HYR domain-containing protein [Lewinellaceae bacterium]
MKKKLNSVYKLFFAAFSGIVFLSVFLNPPNGNTGAPPTFSTCTNCHSGGSGTGNITIQGMPATIMPNTLYPITVSVTRTNGTPVYGGFQMVVQDGMNQNSGTLSNPGPSSALDASGGKTYFEHAPAQEFIAGNTVTYTVDWLSPSTGSGNITMYAAGNLANGNGNSSGDAIVTTSATGMFMGGGGVISVLVNGINVSCFGGNNGTASASASGGGGGPYTFNWSNGSSGPTITNLIAGVYTVTVTNLSGGSGTGSVTITQPATPVNVSIVSQMNIDCLNPIGSATAQGTGGSPGYTYNWTGGGMGQTVTLPPGNFTVTVTDANNCTSAVSGNLTSNTAPPNAEAGPPVVISCATPAVNLNGTGSSVGSNFTYLWNTTDGHIVSGANTLMPLVDKAGTYTLTVTNNQNFCTATDFTTVAGSSTPPVAEAGPAMTLTCANTNVTLNGTGSSSGANFTYLWTTTNGHIVSGANTLMPVVDVAGTYTLTVSNTSNGCTQSDQTSVTANTSAPVATAGNDMVLTCAATTIQLNGNGSSSGGNFTYQWTTANGNIVSGANTLTPTVNEPGTYCLQVSNSLNGCTATDCTNVTENTSPPIANAGSAAPLTCTVSSVTLNGSASSSGPNFTYLWITGNGNIVSGETTTMPLVNSAGSYTIIVTNTNNGCTAVSNVSVNSNTTPPNADAGSSMALNCNNLSVVLNGSNSSQGGNFTYLWDGPGIVSGANTTNPTVDAAGTYNITVTNTNTGCTATDNTLVYQTPPLMVSIPTSNNVECNGNNTGNATAQGTGGNGGYDFHWSNGTTGQEAANLAAGNYTVTLIDADDCTATSSISISEPAELIANAVATGESSTGANDGSATCNPIGGIPAYSFSWSNGETTQTITGLSAGTYTVTLSDGNSCTKVESVTVASFNCASFGISISSTNPSCNGSMDGVATANPTGGTGPFTYMWSNGSTENTANNLGAGTYNVTVADNNNCEIAGNVTLMAPPPLSLSVPQQTNVTCNGVANGSASVAAGGGSPGYSYEWPGGVMGASQSGLTAGNYLVTATDANSCTKTIQVNITQPPALAGAATATSETSVGANDGTATINPSGGVSPYQYNWSNNATTPTINNLSPAEYCATVTDANGCTITGCATVDQFGCIGQTIVVSGENVTCYGVGNGMAMLTATGFEDPVTVEWSNGSAGSSIGNLPAAIYSVTVTGADGCFAVEEIEITEPAALAVNILNQTNLECPGEMTGVVSVGAEGGTPVYTFSWPSGSNNPTQSNLPAGTYEVTVSDQNDCVTTLAIEIGIDPDTEPPQVLAQGIIVNLDADGIASVTPEMLDGGSTDNCGIVALTMDISDFDCSNIGINDVVLSATDLAGNTSTANATVTVLDNIPPIITCPENISITVDVCETTVNYDEPTAIDNCQNTNVFILSGPISGATFPNGTTEVTWGADDNHGNTVFCTFTVTVLSDFAATASFTEPTCSGASDGIATALPVNGTPPFGYEWDDPANQTTQTATGLLAGEYLVYITDSEGCVASAAIVVTEPDPVSITIDQVAGETGNNMDGAISVSVFGGTGAPFTYQWSFNGSAVSSEEDPAGLAAGEYLLEVSDQNGCTASVTVVVDQLSAVGNLNIERSVSIFPVPTSGRLFIKVELPGTAVVNIEILDLTGRLVLDETYEAAQGKDIVFDLTENAPGVYLVRFVAGDEVFFKRIVLSR